MAFLQISMRLKCLCLFTIALSATLVADEMILENFESNPEQRWRYVSDQVMGGVSTGQVVYIQEGDVNYAHMTGSVSTENNGGFIQLRSNVAKGTTAEV